MNLIAGLLKASMFHEFTADQLEILARVMVEQRYRAGHVFIEEGDRPHPVMDALFLVLEGTVHVTTERRRTAGEAPLAALGPGDLFGVVALVDEGRRSARCEAAGEVRVASLTRQAYQLLVRTDVRVATQFQHALARQLARDLRAMDVQLREMVGAGRLSATQELVRS